jgi:hypothetical protein
MGVAVARVDGSGERLNGVLDVVPMALSGADDGDVSSRLSSVRYADSVPAPALAL